MPRPALYSADDIAEAAVRVLAREGPRGATLAAVGRELGAPTGSIYHRFPSRVALMAEAWLKVVEAFQRGFLECLDLEPALEGGSRAVRFVPEWVRRSPEQARVLLLYRREDLTGGEWPPAVAQRAIALGEEIRAGLSRFAARAFEGGSRDGVLRARFALMDVPYGALRRYAATGQPPPPILDDLLEAAYLAVVKEDRNEPDQHP